MNEIQQRFRREQAMSVIFGANHALLVGEVLGSLMVVGFDVEPVRDDEGNYTGELVITKPSGTYRLTVEPLVVTEP